MSSGDFASGRTVPLLIPEPVWQEWKMNGVGAESLAELQAEHGAAVGYEFDWGQIIEECSTVIPTLTQKISKTCPAWRCVGTSSSPACTASFFTAAATLA